jgi:hypothetical protein
MSTRTTVTAPRSSPLRRSPTGQEGADAPANHALNKREWIQVSRRQPNRPSWRVSAQQPARGPSRRLIEKPGFPTRDAITCNYLDLTIQLLP